MDTLADRILAYHRQLTPEWPLPPGWQVLFPFRKAETWRVMEIFYRKYYSDCARRTLLFGINPGRFGAGITGIAFTDPIRLEAVCGIANDFEKKPELSSVFIYELVERMGGPEAFFGKYYITSVSPLGFVHEGLNANYYDHPELLRAVRPLIEKHIQAQIAIFGPTRIALSVGQGQNYQFFQKANRDKGWFEEIWPLPHPRWVMQYRRRQKNSFVERYVERLTQAHQRNLSERRHE